MYVLLYQKKQVLVWSYPTTTALSILTCFEPACVTSFQEEKKLLEAEAYCGGASYSVVIYLVYDIRRFGGDVCTHHTYRAEIVC